MIPSGVFSYNFYLCITFKFNLSSEIPIPSLQSSQKRINQSRLTRVNKASRKWGKAGIRGTIPGAKHIASSTSFPPPTHNWPWGHGSISHWCISLQMNRLPIRQHADAKMGSPSQELFALRHWSGGPRGEFLICGGSLCIEAAFAAVKERRMRTVGNMGGEGNVRMSVESVGQVRFIRQRLRRVFRPTETRKSRVVSLSNNMAQNSFKWFWCR